MPTNRRKIDRVPNNIEQMFFFVGPCLCGIHGILFTINRFSVWFSLGNTSQEPSFRASVTWYLGWTVLMVHKLGFLGNCFHCSYSVIYSMLCASTSQHSLSLSLAFSLSGCIVDGLLFLRVANELLYCNQSNSNDIYKWINLVVYSTYTPYNGCCWHLSESLSTCFIWFCCTVLLWFYRRNKRKWYNETLRCWWKTWNIFTVHESHPVLGFK